MTASSRPRGPRSVSAAAVLLAGTALGPPALGTPALGTPALAEVGARAHAVHATIGLQATGSPTATTAKPRSDGGITAVRILANGSLRFAPPPLSVRPKTGRLKARSVADKAVPGSAAGRAAEVFFALFSASSPARRGGDGRLVPVFDGRPVWVIRYAAVRGERQTGVIVRRAGTTLQPTTTVALTVYTDIVVVVDDDTASEVLRSEYAS